MIIAIVVVIIADVVRRTCAEQEMQLNDNMMRSKIRIFAGDNFLRFKLNRKYP